MRNKRQTDTGFAITAVHLFPRFYIFDGASSRWNICFFRCNKLSVSVRRLSDGICKYAWDRICTCCDFEPDFYSKPILRYITELSNRSWNCVTDISSCRFVSGITFQFFTVYREYWRPVTRMIHKYVSLRRSIDAKSATFYGTVKKNYRKTGRRHCWN